MTSTANIDMAIESLTTFLVKKFRGLFSISAAAPQSPGVEFLLRPTLGDAPFLGIRLDRIDSFFSLAFEEVTEICPKQGAFTNAYPTRRLLQQAHHDTVRSFLITGS